MVDQDPVLRQIHDKFDGDFFRYPYSDHSVTSRVRFSEQKDGFTVKMYAGGFGNAYDGLVIAVTEKNGHPTQASIGRDSGGIMVLNVQSVEEVDHTSGLTEMNGTIGGELKEGQRILRPQDPEFGLIRQLSEQIAPVRLGLRNLLGNKSDQPEIEFGEKGVYRLSGKKKYDRGQPVEVAEHVRTQVTSLYSK